MSVRTLYQNVVYGENWFQCITATDLTEEGIGSGVELFGGQRICKKKTVMIKSDEEPAIASAPRFVHFPSKDPYRPSNYTNDHLVRLYSEILSCFPLGELRLNDDPDEQSTSWSSPEQEFDAETIIARHPPIERHAVQVRIVATRDGEHIMGKDRIDELSAEGILDDCEISRLPPLEKRPVKVRIKRVRTGKPMSVDLDDIL